MSGRRSLPRVSRVHPAALLVLLIGALTGVLVKSPGFVPPARNAVSTEKITGPVRVDYVYDGDTIRLAGKQRVRLIGIDAPEMHDNAKLMRDVNRSGRDAEIIKRAGFEAGMFARKLMDGKQVRLEYDVEPVDKYGRFLAYVYLEDGTFVNAEIIRNGYASPMTIPPNVAHADEFKKCYAEARKSGAGLWRADGGFFTPELDDQPKKARKKKRS